MIFNYKCYDTPPNRKRCIWDKLVFNSRLYFYWKFLFIILKARRDVENGLLSGENYCKISNSTFKLLEDCGGKIHIRGLDNIRKEDGPAVFVSNHMSMLEAFVLPAFIIPVKPVSFVVKESLIHHRFFGKVMKGTRPIPVTRNNPVADYRSVMTEGRKLLNSGRSIAVFPQKTRGREFIPEEFTSIGEKLARKAKVPMVPIAVKTDFWGKGKVFSNYGPIHRDRHIHIEFGAPIHIHNDAREVHSEIVHFIENKLKLWNN